MKYTIEDIKDAWEKFKNQQVLRYSKGGVKYLVDLDGKRFPSIEGAIRPEIMTADKAYSFPEFLEQKWKQ